MSEESRLGSVLSKHSLVCGAIIGASGDIVCRVGDFDALKSQGLVESLLGPYGSPKATFDSLEGQLLPRTWCQGDAFAVVDRVGAERTVVVFGRGTGDVFWRHELSQEVAISIRNAFGDG